MLQPINDTEADSLQYTESFQKQSQSQLNQQPLPLRTDNREFFIHMLKKHSRTITPKTKLSTIDESRESELDNENLTKDGSNQSV